MVTETEHRGNAMLLTLTGDLQAASAPVLNQALREVTGEVEVVMVDLHGVPLMDTAGLLLLLDLHRRAECQGLRVLVVGWQPQPQQFMAAAAGLPGPGSPAAERYALAGFRRLIEERVRRTREPAKQAEGGAGRDQVRGGTAVPLVGRLT